MRCAPLSEGVLFGNYNALSFEIGLSERFAFQPEVIYLQKGGKIGWADNDGRGNGSDERKGHFPHSLILSFPHSLKNSPMAGQAMSGRST